MDLTTAAVRQLLIFVHLIAFAFALVAVLREDMSLLLQRNINNEHLRSTAKQVSLLLLVLWVTGLSLIVMDLGWQFAGLSAKPKLMAKLCVVSLLTANGVLLHVMAFPALSGSVANVRRAATICTVLGTVSSVSWVFASFVGVARLVATHLGFSGFFVLYVAALAMGLTVGLLQVRPLMLSLITRARKAVLAADASSKGMASQPRFMSPEAEAHQRRRRAA